MPSNASPLSDAQRASEFPITSEYTYLNTAAQGPLPAATCRAVEQALARAQFPETPRARVETAPVDVARARMARLLGVGEDDVTFTLNTSYGMNICARGIEWRPGDNAVIPAREFPSLTRAWAQLRDIGVELRIVPWEGAGPSVDALMAAVDSRTRAVSCSAVLWDTGYRIDLEDLGRRCQAAGALLIVDGIQAVAAADLDLRALRVSAVSTHAYKWLMASFGCGVLYVAPEAVDRIRPRIVGEQSIANGADPADTDAPLQPGARRYTAGTSNTFGLVALGASLGLIEQLGMPAVAAHNRALGEQLVAGLLRHADRAQLVSPADPERRASIVVFTLGDHARDAELVRRLGERGIVVAHRPRGVRVSPHLYNTVEDIERLLAALPECWS